MLYYLNLKMDTELNLLFIYGSLLDETNEFASYLQCAGEFISKGKFRGKLFDIGNYPCALADPFSKDYVYGSLIKLYKFTETIKIIDKYEGFGIEQIQPNEFIRVIKDIETDTVTRSSWVYLYNLSIDGFPQILSGSYIKQGLSSR